MVAAMALAAVMVAPSAMMSASAATANKVTITDEQGPEPNEYQHKYTVYKIFNGTVNKDTGALEEISFAKGNGFDAFLTALKQDSTLGRDFTDATNEAAVAHILSGYANNIDKAKAFAKFVADNKGLVSVAVTSNVSPITLEEDGYYLIIEDTPTGTPTDVGLTSYLLTQYDASEGVDIAAKSSIPSVEKKIKENESYTADAGYGAGYNDTADYCIGDTVPFELIGTLPANIGDYDTYKYIFHDTLGSEFNPNNDIVVTVVNGTDKKEVAAASYSTDAADGDTITVTFNNLLTINDKDGEEITIDANSKIYVNYTAVLNNDAVIGRNGQKNKVYLEYSNNPNQGGEGTSKTPEDQVVAFTYELDVNKIDSVSKEALNGAQFALYKTVANVDYYAAIDANGKIVDWIPGSFADTTFTKTEGTSNLYGTSTSDASLTTGSTFKFIGLDDGTYMLKEVVAPEGYNEIKNDIKVEIDANTSNGQNKSGDGTELIKLELKVDDASKQVFDASATDDDATTDIDEAAVNAAGLNAGVLSFDVENKSGSTLPSTGGIGTKLFVVGGGLAAAMAGVYLVSKKKAKDETAE